MGDLCLLSWTTLMAGESILRNVLDELGHGKLEQDPGALNWTRTHSTLQSGHLGNTALPASMKKLATAGVGILSCATALFRCMPEIYGVAASQLVLGTLHYLLGETTEAKKAFDTNLDGFHPAHLAGISNRAYCLRCALACGARLDVFDHQGYSVLDYVRMASRLSIEQVLLTTFEGQQLQRDSDMKQRMRSAVTTLHCVRDEARAAGHRVSSSIRRAFCERILPEHCEIFAPMLVVPLEAFLAFGAVPRSSDGLGVSVDTLPEDAMVVLVSHRWLRPVSNPAHPDDEHGTKFAQICSILAAATQGAAAGKPTYVWIDFASIEQDECAVLLKGVSSLPLYVQCVDIFISLSNHEEYYDRAWCRLEVLFAKASFDTSRLPQMYEPPSETDSNLKTHRAISDDTIAELVQPEMVRTARLSCESDRHMVSFLSTQASVLRT